MSFDYIPWSPALPLHIALLAPCQGPARPMYADILGFVHRLADELRRRKQRVTLFAPASVPRKPKSGARRASTSVDLLRPVMVDQLLERAGEFDLVHNFGGPQLFPLRRSLTVPLVSTIETPVRTEEERALYEHFGELPLVATSAYTADSLADRRVVTIPPGAPAASRLERPESERYLVAVDAIGRAAGTTDAMRVAMASNLRLQIVGHVPRGEVDYFENWVRPALDHPGNVFVGEVEEGVKREIVANAVALVTLGGEERGAEHEIIEALSRGTPALVGARASAAEVVDDGVNGWIVSDNTDGARRVVEEPIDPADVLRHFRRRFDIASVADAYLHLYERLVVERNSLGSAASGSIGAPT